MKRVLATLIFLFSVMPLSAENYTSISLQGILDSTDPVSNVSVSVWADGNQVDTGDDVDIVPDADGNFVVFLTGIDLAVFRSGNSVYAAKLSTGTYEVLTATFTSVPFALAIKGASSTDNLVGVSGNVGIGTTSPAYRLHVSSDAGATGTIFAISTGTSSDMFRVTGAGDVYATKYYGDGSSLTGISTGGDNLGNHTATTHLEMAGKNIHNVNSVTATNDITAARYQIAGANVLTTPAAGGTYNLSVGLDAGHSNSGEANTFVGHSAGATNTTGGGNVLIGSFAGLHNTIGSGNTFNGYEAGAFNTTGGLNTFVGGDAGFKNTAGSNNLFVGYNTGFQNTTGNYNAFVGAWTGGDNTTGSNNTFIGNGSGRSNTTADHNVFIGHFTGRGNTTGYDNYFAGSDSGFSNTTGFFNTFVGNYSGFANTTGSNNIIIGVAQDASTPDTSNELNIGGVLFGNLSDKTVGVSTRIPQAALDIVSTGTTTDQMAQIWRNSSGVVVGSMSATGALKAATFIGDGSGLTGITVGDADISTNLAGGLANQIPYQTAPNTTAFINQPGADVVLFANNSAPLWTNAPTLSGTNITSVASLANTDSAGQSAITAINSATAGTISWSHLDKTGSNLTDLTTRDHSVLSSTGINTHAQIDTHLALTETAHGATSTDAPNTIVARDGTGSFAAVAITASSFTATGVLGIGAHLMQLSANVTISSETSTDVGAGVRISSNIYIVGFSSATKYYGDASSMTGLPEGDNLGTHIATTNLNLNNHQITDVASLVVTNAVTASSFTAADSSLGVDTAKLKFTNSNVILSSASPTQLGGIYSSTHVFIAGSVQSQTIAPIAQAPYSGQTGAPDSNYNVYFTTAAGGTITFSAPTGAPVNGQKILVRIKDDGTARSVVWDGAYRAGNITLPTTTVANKTMYIGFMYNSYDGKWDMLALATGF